MSTNSEATLNHIRRRRQEHQKWKEGEAIKPALKKFYYSRLVEMESILVMLFESLKYDSVEETPSELVLTSAVLDKIQDWEGVEGVGGVEAGEGNRSGRAGGWCCVGMEGGEGSSGE